MQSKTGREIVLFVYFWASKRLMLKNILYFCALILVFEGCLPSPYFQREEAVSGNEWSYNYRPKFKFDITDTTAKYQPYFIIQHSQAYPYCNLWMWMYIKTPGDSLIKKERVNVLLADPSGKWLGRGLGSIYEERVYLSLGDSVQFNRKGTYEIALEQNMRVNPLPEVLHVGLRVEKINIQK